MKTQHLELQFHTPAFLGDAAQQGAWRTPPIKAQLRQWWRMAYIAQKNHQDPQRLLQSMRTDEGKLFGNAWLEGDFSKSQVRLRLAAPWETGKLRQFEAGNVLPVRHPEVPRPVQPHLYLGYGPLKNAEGQAKLKFNAAIQAQEKNTLQLAYPDTAADLIETALQLMDAFGTLGGRSRNGWGSYSLRPLSGAQLVNPPAWPVRDWQHALQWDWPHSIGKDERGALIWQTQPHAHWSSLMRQLAEIKIALRTAFKFPNAQPNGGVFERHWLSYPVTNHDVRAWKNLRLPNTLRFKVRPTPEGRLLGMVVHIPHAPPAQFASQMKQLTSVWQQVHRHLDASKTLTRSTF